MNAGSLRRGRRAPYAQVPEPLLFDPTLSSHAKVIWGLLSRRIDQRDGSETESLAFPGRAWLAKHLSSGQTPGVTERTVDRALDELKRRGWIEVERRGNGLTNSYVVHDWLIEGLDPDSTQMSTPDSTSVSSQDSTQMSTPRKESKGNESKENENTADSASLRPRATPPAPPGARPPVSPPSVPPASRARGETSQEPPTSTNPHTDLFGETVAARSARGATKAKTRSGLDRHVDAFRAKYPLEHQSSSDKQIRAAFARATKRARAAEILEGLDAWLAKWKADGFAYVPDAANWLNNEKWTTRPVVRGKRPQPIVPEVLPEDLAEDAEPLGPDYAAQEYWAEFCRIRAENAERYRRGEPPLPFPPPRNAPQEALIS